MSDQLAGSNKVTVLTNSQDQYLLDEEKALAVGQWMRDCLTAAEAKGALGSPGLMESVKIESFCEAFPYDSHVIEYRQNNGAYYYNRLLFHISIVEKQIPVATLFDLYGMTSDKLLTRLASHVDSTTELTSLRAIELALKYKYPTEKPIRVKNIQNNTLTVTDDKQKQELMERILARINGKAELNGPQQRGT
jgi:hypothetical protein